MRLINVYNPASLSSWSPRPYLDLVTPQVVIQGGICFLFGREKIGKSLLAEHLGFAVSSGQEWLGFRTHKAPALYLQTEVVGTFYKTRITAMLRYFQQFAPTAAEFLVEVTDERLTPLDKPKGKEDLEREINTRRPGLLILDPLYQFIANTTPEGYLEALNNVKILAKDYNLAVVIIAHSRKDKFDDQGSPVNTGNDSLWGPGQQLWYADSILHLVGTVESQEQELSFTLRHGAGISPKRIYFDNSSFIFRAH